MALSRWDRKARLPFGAQKEIAEELQADGVKCDESDVSRVLHGKASHLNPEKVQKIQSAIAKRLRPRVSVAEAFPTEEDLATAKVS
jgi:arginine repressor